MNRIKIVVSLFILTSSFCIKAQQNLALTPRQIVNGNKEIRLFRTKPSEAKVTEFANHLINIANNKKKVMLIDFDLSEEHFFDNIQYLFAINLINRKELEELKYEYKLKRLL